MNRHWNALAYATKAVNTLMNLQKEEENKADSTKENYAIGKEGKNTCVSLGIAYYNMAAEYEFVGDYKLAVETYFNGIEATKKFLPESHPVLKNLMNGYEDAKLKRKTRTDFHIGRSKTRSEHATRNFFTKKKIINENEMLVSNQLKKENLVCPNLNQTLKESETLKTTIKKWKKTRNQSKFTLNPKSNF